MRFIKDLKEGDRLSDVYYIKQKNSAVTKNGKPYDNLIIQDRSGQIEAKVWDTNSPGIDDVDALEYAEIGGEVTSFNGQLQVRVTRIRRVSEGEYDIANYLLMTKKDISEMQSELLGYISSVQNIFYRGILEHFFKDDAFMKKFSKMGAAKSVHHGFIGGLLEHTISVTKTCDFFAKSYPVLNRDLLITAAICHDIGKVREFSDFPLNDYTDEGQLIGHIVMGSEMISEAAKDLPGYSETLLNQLKHCILAHHGKYEYGSPKIPAIIEAFALNYADDIDAKIETFTEFLEKNDNNTGWLGFYKFLDSNLHRTWNE